MTSQWPRKLGLQFGSDQTIMISIVGTRRVLMLQGTHRWASVLVPGEAQAEWFPSPAPSWRCFRPCGVYPFLILRWCAHWWAVEHIQNVFGAVSYYVLKNNKLHTAVLLLPLFLSFKATGELKIPTSFQGPHRVQVTTNRRVRRPWSPCLLWRTHSAPAESPLGPSASGRMPARAPQCRHGQQAAPCWQCGAAPPAHHCPLLGHRDCIYYSRW